jgi:hypothetical protein
MDPDIHIVNHQHHYLPTCPCLDCRKKRTRQVGSSFSPSSKQLIAVPPKVAYLFGLIPRLLPEGSLARSLRK